MRFSLLDPGRIPQQIPGLAGAQRKRREQRRVSWPMKSSTPSATRTTKACSVGRKAHQGRSQRPVAWSTERKETEFLELDDKAAHRDGERVPGPQRTVNASWPRKGMYRRPSPFSVGEGRMERRRLTDATERSGGVISGGTGARTSRETGEALLVPVRNDRRKVDRITGNTGKLVERREGVGRALLITTPFTKREAGWPEPTWTNRHGRSCSWR
jgi:hypothetical protein